MDKFNNLNQRILCLLNMKRWNGCFSNLDHLNV